MNNRSLIGQWIRRFLLEHMIGERNLARNTQASYRDTLTIFLPFVSTEKKKPIDHLVIEDFSPSVVRQFLDHLEKQRNCGAVTRNLRLGAIHSLAKFIGMRSPEHLAWCTEVRAIPFRKTAKAVVDYLDKPEMDALLQVSNNRTELGARNYALLQFLFNTGARADEAAQVTVADLTFGNSPSVRLLGKGNKMRCCPIWPETAETLKHLTFGMRPQDGVFIGRRGLPLTRFGIYNLVHQAGKRACAKVGSIQSKRVSPHTIRHTAAVHALRSGMDINTLRAWLGHVSVDTTNIYAEVDLEMKAKALAHCDIFTGSAVKRWRQEPTLMAFLKAL